MSTLPISEEAIRETFHDITHQVARHYDFPELKKAKLEIVDNGHREDDDVFPMREFDSRKPHFEFSRSRFARYNMELEGWLADKPVADRGLETVGLFMFIGAAVVRPIVEYEQFSKFGRRGPRHIKVISQFYTKRNEVEDMFENILGNSPTGDKTVVNEISDKDVMKINGLRVYYSYLYAGLPMSDVDNDLFGDLLRDGRGVIAETIVRERPEFKKIGRTLYNQKAQDDLDEFDITDESIVFEPEPEIDVQRVADRLCSSVLPNWLISLATPVSSKSFGHLGSKVWDDKFYIEASEISETIVDDQGDISFDDELLSMLPSHCTVPKE